MDDTVDGGAGGDNIDAKLGGGDDEIRFENPAGGGGRSGVTIDCEILD